MPGSRLSNTTARNYTPFSFYAKVTPSMIVDITSTYWNNMDKLSNFPQLYSTNTNRKANPVIDLSTNINGNDNSILVTPFYETSRHNMLNFKGIVPSGLSLYVSLTLFKGDYYPVTDSNGDIKNVLLWTLVETKSNAGNAQITEFKNLYGGIYKVVITGYDAPTTENWFMDDATVIDIILNVSWNDEHINTCERYTKYLYGDEKSILPPPKYAIPTSSNIVNNIA